MSMVSHASPRTARWLVLSAATLACVGVTMACVGASPLLFGIAHERTGSFDAVTTPLLALLAVAAAVLAAARPPT